MKNYTIYFEIFGKKLKTDIIAENELKAKEIIRDKIIFNKIEINNNNDDSTNNTEKSEVVDFLLSFFNKK